MSNAPAVCPISNRLLSPDVGEGWTRVEQVTSEGKRYTSSWHSPVKPTRYGFRGGRGYRRRYRAFQRQRLILQEEGKIPSDLRRWLTTRN